ncbi:electron transport complex subunit RsxA [Isachenkonia alkalipeptolytica]|uniref:Ion-translocating oxidoreductase complex subunit A n=1 Tax=Isachenkonia alkalipeptolytica TaxID=2565777 RepID=A0AA43XLB9_9CLOT|nr:electron transport complex subunit RsxA [Isachenkonia alkalipeptolytica]NBG88958.1 electron transport complex subunit RsxA [Isachenkonia alkalipeptolytica]
MLDLSVSSLFAILVSAILVNNFVLSRFLGICPFLGVSKQVETAFGMGMAVTFVMSLASIITFIVQNYILDPLGLQYMQTIMFILVIASLVQLVEMVIQKTSPALYQSLGVFLPLITTNCAVLGLTILNIQENYNIVETIVHAIGAAVGFSLAIVLFAAIREKLEIANVPQPFKGFPIALLTAGLMSLAFLGFSGLV